MVVCDECVGVWLLVKNCWLNMNLALCCEPDMWLMSL